MYAWYTCPCKRSFHAHFLSHAISIYLKNPQIQGLQCRTRQHKMAVCAAHSCSKTSDSLVFQTKEVSTASSTVGNSVYVESQASAITYYLFKGLDLIQNLSQCLVNQCEPYLTVCNVYMLKQDVSVFSMMFFNLQLVG